jgi:hypothetical protein
MANKNIFRFSPGLIVGIFFGLFILTGLCIYKDYGVSTDETASFNRGKMNYERITGELSQEKFQEECKNHLNVCYYPPLFEVFLYALAPSGESQTIFQTRHLATFLFFAFSVFTYFLLGTKILKNWKFGLIGSLFLILSPRIFAHSFYNPKDLPFLSAYTIAMFTMIMFIRKKNVLYAIGHGLATGLACSIRNPGLILIVITYFIYFLTVNLTKSSWRKPIFLIGIYTVITFILMYVSFPVLYSHPIENFIKSFNIMKQYPWLGYQLYMGEDITTHIPWHYSLVWFAISTPLAYVLLFGVGVVAFLIKVKHSKITTFLTLNLELFAMGLCGVLPIIVVILMKSILYLDNRQMYFCYPGLLLFSIYGFSAVVDKFYRFSISRKLQLGIVTLFLVLSVLEPLYFMIKYHPYENVYFNFLAGPRMSVIRNRFGLDTWSLSNKQALEYILKTDNHKKIKVAIISYYSDRNELVKLGGNMISPLILTESEKNRLTITSKSPDYIIYTYRYSPLVQIDLPVFYSIKVGNTDILTVYRNIN